MFNPIASEPYLPSPARNPAMNTVKSFLVQAAITSVALGQFCEHQWEGKFADHEVDGVPYLQARQNVAPPPLEIRPLIVNGPSSNRVDLIFFGDGYTEDEKDKFFADALFLANNITDGQTFFDVLPVLNFWAGFSPSNESGVGTGGKPLDTVYGLYRDGTELRGVYYDKPEVARAACQSTDACDFPILLGNDPLYGGLGGTFTVTTSSPNNGPVIIRHELGHSIIGVGEEYDGGEVYTGVNAAKSTNSVPWTQWYTDASTEPKIQRTNMPVQEYPWTLLNTSQSWIQTFTSAGTYSTHLLQVSVSGVTATSDLLVEIDGKDAGWEWNPAVGEDRYIYNIKINEALTPGEHEIKFTLLNEERQGSAQLCSFEVLEYGDEEEFDFEPRYHGLYPTFSSRNVTSYRPTNDLCLMRDTYSSNFCDACIEGLWLSLLGRLALIDNITQDAQPDGSTNATLNLLPLANLRQVPNPHQEAYTILWYGVDGTTVLEDWTNSTTALLGPDITEFGVEVRFTTEQVRVDSAGVLVQKERYSVE
ncbi:IgA peptidase M64-domain-containing protein [Daldinia loculata]|uniref:IgA peptidase M64-domain-containing protein n=1 Tax=Daldinia loculata TaxID=103429 RepID=UPI0020C2C59B|nr:IgA peptidase M64-domain-containing protein [Daldinia loculata]KAI1650986.1 IgA peptidase M64-domain-containing protein [Daldinia loculata]